ncbi:MAG: DUF4935 domain-containing protein [Lachnospiraceae bacterium]|nr:DUF4935 domain-containing protein [Lachnospiraceae bacterium]
MFHYPINITIDTNVFYAAKYDLSEGSTLRILASLVEEGKIKVCLSSIIIREAESHIRKQGSSICKEVRKAVSELRKTVDDNALEIVGLKEYTSIPPKDVVMNGLISRFEGYIQSLKPEILDVSTINVEKIMDDYFKFNPPFENSEKKRKEFPDAFIADQIRVRFPENNSVIIVSNDAGFKQACLKDRNYICYNCLGDLYDEMNKQDDNYKVVLSVLSEVGTQIDDMIRDNIETNELITVHGLSFDRKGIASGYDYSETSLNSIENVTHRLHIIDDIKENEAIITLNCSADIEMDCYYEDYDNAPWDSDAKEYVYVETIHVLEKHKARFGVRLYLDIQEKELKINDVVIILGEDSRQERKIINKNDSWNNFDEEFTQCPDCGCRVTIKNDGGNGFCINCAPNH